MWIFCCGGQRSGSTLQYNIVSEIVEKTNSGKRIGYIESWEFNHIQEEYQDFSGYKVIKCHKLNSEIQSVFDNKNAIGFHCYRDVRDVIVSLINKGDIRSESKKDIKKKITEYIKEFENWYYTPGIYSSKYEKFTSSLEVEVDRVCKILKVDLPLGLKQEIIYRNTLPNVSKVIGERNTKKEKYDSFSLFHHNHIFSGKSNQWKSQLKKSTVNLIEAEAYNWLYNYGYELTCKKWYKKVKLISFSQCGEDDLIWRFFGKSQVGNIVEIGAFDGKHLSNSLSLENLGWKTICVEANPFNFNLLESNRPFTNKYFCAVVGREYNQKYVDFYIEESGLYSGVSVDEVDVSFRYHKRGLKFDGFRTERVPAKTLNSILLNQFYNVQDKLHCMTIDVEGSELSVLSGIDLNKYNIDLLVIEANSADQEQKLKKYLQKYDYACARRLGPNLIFCKKKNVGLLLRVKQNYLLAKQQHPKGQDYKVESLSSPELKRVSLVSKVLSIWEKLKFL